MLRLVECELPSRQVEIQVVPGQQVPAQHELRWRAAGPYYGQFADHADQLAERLVAAGAQAGR